MYCSNLSGKNNLKCSLDELRSKFVTSSKYVPLERLPPTSRAAYFHCLRVHHQTATWKHLKTVLKKEDLGFKFSHQGELIPVITDKLAAPKELLREIRCSCSKGEQLCGSCSCSKIRLFCSIHCKCGGQCSNAPVIESFENDDLIDESY